MPLSVLWCAQPGRRHTQMIYPTVILNCALMTLKLYVLWQVAQAGHCQKLLL